MPVEVRKDQAMIGLNKDKDGRGHCYVVTDVLLGSVVLCTQRLPAAAQFLNAHVCKHDKVNVASLYESAVSNEKRLVHRRFGVRKCALEEAPRTFAQARARFPAARAFVLTMPHRVMLA